MAQIDSGSWQANQRTTFTPTEIKFYPIKNFVSNRGLKASKVRPYQQFPRLHLFGQYFKKSHIFEEVLFDQK